MYATFVIFSSSLSTPRQNTCQNYLLHILFTPVQNLSFKPLGTLMAIFYAVYLDVGMCSVYVFMTNWLFGRGSFFRYDPSSSAILLLCSHTLSSSLMSNAFCFSALLRVLLFLNISFTLSIVEGICLCFVDSDCKILSQLWLLASLLPPQDFCLLQIFSSK